MALTTSWNYITFVYCQSPPIECEFHEGRDFVIFMFCSLLYFQIQEFSGIQEALNEYLQDG